MCETRWQNRKDLTWSGCSGEQGMPAEATECNQTTTKCKNYDKQNMRCYCTSDGCNAKATYPQSCKIFASGAAKKRWNFQHTSCTFHSLDTRILP